MKYRRGNIMEEPNKIKIYFFEKIRDINDLGRLT
jgi:hypothetical protein